MIKEKIVIVGAGYSGMILSLALASKKISTILLEAKSLDEVKKFRDPRTTALSATSTAFFNEINIWDSLSKFCEPIQSIYVCQNMADNMINFNSQQVPMGHMIENQNFYHNLHKLVANNSFIKSIYGAKYKDINLTDDSVTLHFYNNILDNSNTIKADLCVVAEGKFSSIKQKFFENTIEKDYQQKAIIFNISHTINHEGMAIEHFLPRGPFATLPLRGGFASSIVWTESTALADLFTTLDNNLIIEIIKPFIGGALGDIKIITKPECYPLSANITKNYNCKKLVLIADSAHIIHPLAGQGLNQGVKDIMSLFKIINYNHNLGLKITSLCLEEYQKNRKLDNFVMLQFTDKINSIFKHQNILIKAPINFGFGLIDNINFLKKAIVSYAEGKSIN